MFGLRSVSCGGDRQSVDSVIVRDDPAVALLAIVLAALIAAAATRLVKPRHDPWQPDELSRLGPPFPSPTNGKNHV